MCYLYLIMRDTPVILALDGMSGSESLDLARRLGPAVGTYKIGLELFTRYGPDLVRRFRDLGKEVFLDLKYHDIPATVGKAVAAAVRLGPSLLTVHGTGGGEMLRAAVDARGESGTRLLAVTVLTSSGAEGVGDRVVEIARTAADAGVDGVVASVAEVRRVKAACGDRFLVVTPGIRPAGADRNDQARTATPGEAARAGSDYLVVGRPVTRAADPAAALGAIMEGIRRDGE